MAPQLSASPIMCNARDCNRTKAQCSIVCHVRVPLYLRVIAGGIGREFSVSDWFEWCNEELRNGTQGNATVDYKISEEIETFRNYTGELHRRGSLPTDFRSIYSFPLRQLNLEWCDLQLKADVYLSCVRYFLQMIICSFIVWFMIQFVWCSIDSYKSRQTQLTMTIREIAVICHFVCQYCPLSLCSYSTEVNWLCNSRERTEAFRSPAFPLMFRNSCNVLVGSIDEAELEIFWQNF